MKTALLCLSIGLLILPPVAWAQNDDIIIEPGQLRQHLAKGDDALKLFSHGQQSWPDGSPTLQAERLMADKPAQLAAQIIREAALFQLAQQLRSSHSEAATQALKLIATGQPKIKTPLDDNGHQALVLAFPFAQSAQSSLTYQKISILSEQFLPLIQTANFSAIQQSFSFMQQQSLQKAVVKRNISQLNQQQAGLFANWLSLQPGIDSEALLILGLKAKNSSLVETILTGNAQLPLHRYLSAITELWPEGEQIELFSRLSRRSDYASLLTYSVAKLTVPKADKLSFWLSQLGDDNSGASAAHMLAEHMNPQVAEDLVSLLMADKAAKQLSQPARLKRIQTSAVLALKLSNSSEAAHAIEALKKSDYLLPSLVKELAND